MSETTPTSVDILVIGGGVSGLAVASGLAGAGPLVLVLEARGRLGGRVETQAVPGGFADLGPTWFWPGESRIESLVDKLGLAVHEQWNAGDAVVMVDGQPARARFQAPLSFRFSEGAVALIDGLAGALNGAKVLLDCPVESVRRSGDGIVARTNAGDVRAKTVVVALPPSLACAGGLIRAEDLDADVAAAASAVAVWMGAITKAVACYEESFWRDRGLSGFASCPRGPFHEIHDMSGPDGRPAMLFGFGQSAPIGRRLSAADFVEQLTTVLGPEAARPIHALERDWGQEPWTTPEVWPASTRYDLFGAHALQRPSWDGRLLWTSTETASVAPGHLEGALEAAARTIGHVLSAMS